MFTFTTIASPWEPGIPKQSANNTTAGTYAVTLLLFREYTRNHAACSMTSATAMDEDEPMKTEIHDQMSQE